jgi:hypothetical protein
MRKSENFKRIFEAVQLDKSVIGEACKSLIEKDLAVKLGEYFDMSSAPVLDVAFIQGKYRVTLSFEAERVKNFNVLK